MKHKFKSGGIITDSSSRYEHFINVIRASIEMSRQNLAALDQSYLDIIHSISIMVAKCISSGGKVLICGNGGSASDAMHIAGELIGRFKLERRPYHVVALGTNTAAATAIGNDYGYEHIFERETLGLGDEGDILIGISTSGNSKNVIAALNAARTLKMKTIGFTGKNGGKMKCDGLCDVILNVPSDDTPKIQEMHITCGHIICQLAEIVLSESEKNNESR